MSRTIDMIILHVSASDLDEHDNIETITKWHIDRGWSDCGYTYYINKNGHVELGRPIEKAPASVKGFNNRSVAICMGGDKFIHPYQIRSAVKLIRDLQFMLKVDINNILGHYELDKNKTCPNVDMDHIRGAVSGGRAWYEGIRGATHLD